MSLIAAGPVFPRCVFAIRDALTGMHLLPAPGSRGSGSSAAFEWTSDVD